MDGVFHVAGGQDDLAWTDQVINDDANIIVTMIMTIKSCDHDHGDGDGDDDDRSWRRCWPGIPSQRHGIRPAI